ncbi:Excalibur calcium-binding domain protein [Pseudoalteromonas sp. P1-9]|nr:Excalibur calcium-binding domain protein [Pseudoalteromonas sp. P1-9]
MREVLFSCDNFELIYHDAVNAQLEGRPIPNYQDALSKYDDNRNGKISCKEARLHGITPVRRDDEAYKYMSDRDGDGIVCE